MKQETSISVIVPVYNSENTIKSCIESILKQNKEDIEIIIIDDGSSDNTAIICDYYANIDKRVKVIHQTNQGRTAAREKGVRTATAEWVCFVDSDDQIPITSLIDLYSMVSNDTDIIFGNGYTLGNENRKVIPIEDFRHLTVKGQGTIGVPWGSLYRQKILKHYLFDLPRKFYMGEDYIFWLRLVFSTSQPVHVVYTKVYQKGADTTCSSFIWTIEYISAIQSLRMQSIPKEKHFLYLREIMEDRIANMMAVAVSQPQKQWKKHKFYQDLLNDMRDQNYQLGIKQRIFLALPSLKLRKVYSLLSNLINKLK